MQEKSLSLNEIRTRCSKLVLDWRNSVGEERQEAQSFVRDLLHAFGISETKAALYEKRVQRSSTGNQGYIDALVPGLLLIEMKSRGRPLALAEAQALDYIQHLPEVEVPKYVLTCNFDSFRILDLKAPAGSDITEFHLEQLPNKAEALAFLAGYETINFGSREQADASIKAAKIMAELYESLEGSGYSDHESSIFLVRTLFLLYADDSGVWPRDSFTNFLSNRTTSDGSDLGPQMALLFQVLNQKLENRFSNLDETLAKFPYVNGGIFAEPLSIASFNKQMRDNLLRACQFNWSEISPAIFGSLFQSVKSPEARRDLGEHYTTETNILKTIRPLFLDELDDLYQSSRNDVPSLKAIRTRLTKIRVLDPACGCGNFLVVSYRELRKIELKVLLRLQELGDKTAVPTLFFERTDLAVQLDNIFGIELEEWPARIAQTALLLTEHQANNELAAALGNAPSILPLEKFEGIHIGNALKTNWDEVVAPSADVFIVGNPPFIGHQTKSVDQVSDLVSVWGTDYDGYLDYVTGWFKKAIDFFPADVKGRFAFVSTNSIVQGQPVAALFRPIFKAGWRIRFAHRTFAWTSEASSAAAVHCVITGFDRHESSTASIFSYSSLRSEPVRISAQRINGYLVDAENVFVDKRSSPLSEQLPEVNFGTMAIDGGFLTVDQDHIEEFRDDPVANKYLRKYVGAKELIQDLPRWCLWLDNIEPQDLKQSTLLKDRVQGCRDFRASSSPTGDAYKYRDTPHLFRPNGQRPNSPYVCFPRVVSEQRTYFTVAHLPAEVIASDAVFTAEDPDGFAFAVASSSMFITWQREVGGRLKSDLRFSSTVVWNNFPLPRIDEPLRKEIIQAGQKLLSTRGVFADRSLADLYNPLAMEPTIIKAHELLDRLVDKAFGATSPLRSNEERVPVLFARYTELTGGSRKAT